MHVGGLRHVVERPRRRDASPRVEEGHTNLVVANRHGLETALQAGKLEQHYSSAR